VGVGPNKLMAKVACKLNKPDAVTCLTKKGFFRVANRIQFRDVTGFGSDLGEELQSIYGECSLKELQDRINEKPSFLKKRIGPEKSQRAHDIMNGICNEPVKNKFVNKGLNCGKRNLRKSNL
jgi:nucleotidyltransferase/DNA polymerase involved in DNA repair